MKKIKAKESADDFYSEPIGLKEYIAYNKWRNTAINNRLNQLHAKKR